MGKVYLTNSSDQTREIALNLVTRCHLGQGDTLTARVLALYGELGSGKTTFVQGLAKGLGITKRIISPTFILIRPYTLYPRPFTLFHIDLYRIENEKEIEGLGLEEIINDSGNIVAIEWAEKIKELLPKKRIDILFEYLDEEKRKIIIKND